MYLSEFPMRYASFKLCHIEESDPVSKDGNPCTDSAIICMVFQVFRTATVCKRDAVPTIPFSRGINPGRECEIDAAGPQGRKRKVSSTVHPDKHVDVPRNDDMHNPQRGEPPARGRAHLTCHNQLGWQYPNISPLS